jgi:hypothetical protein
MNSITNGLGMRKTGDCGRPSQPENPHPNAIFTQVHNTLWRALGEGPEEALAWMACSLDLAETRERPSPADLLARFDPVRLPREPTVLVPEPVA